MLKSLTIFFLLAAIGAFNVKGMDDFSVKMKNYTSESNWSKKSEMIIDLCLESETINFPEVKIQANELLNVGIKQNKESYINSSRFVIAFILNKEGKYDEALDLFYQCERYYQNSENDKNLAYVKVAKGHSFYYKGLYKEAINQYRSAKLIWESLNDSIEVNQSESLVAMALLQMKEFEKAEEILKSCIDFLLPYKKYRTISSYYSQLGELYSTQDKRSESMYNFNKGAEYALKSKDPGTVARAENYLAISAYYNGEKQKAIDLFLSSLAYRIKSKDYKLVCEAYYNIASLYLEEKDFPLAEKYFQLSLKEAEIHDLLQDQADALFELSNLFETQKNATKAYDFLRQYVTIKEKIDNQKIVDSDNNIEALEKLATSNRNLIASNRERILTENFEFEKRRNAITLWSGITIILGLLLLIIWKSKRQV